MKFQKQRFHHHPEQGEYGDCMRTVYADLLSMDRDDVPHLNDGRSKDDVVIGFRQFLAEHGYVEFAFAYDGETTKDAILTTMGRVNPGAYWILSGTSRTGCDHCVICYGDEVIHDPSLTNAGIVGPCSDGLWWVSVLTPYATLAKSNADTKHSAMPEDAE